MAEDMSHDPDADQIGGGLYGRLLSDGPGFGPIGRELTRLLDERARTLVDLTGRHASVNGRPDTGTDDLLWAVCRTDRAAAVLWLCGVNPDHLLRRLPGPVQRPNSRPS
jgi:hypothetical protein